MPGFVKPTRKVVNIEDAFGELIGKKLIKDLHDNEEICPVCHGTGLRIEDNPYGLSDDPDKRAGQFPYKHQSIRFCPNCYNGVVRFCPDCGKQIPRCRTLCDCDKVKPPSNILIAAPALPSGSAGKKIGYRNPLRKSVPYLYSLIKKNRESARRPTPW